MCSYAGYKEVPDAISGLTELTSLKLENQCFETPASQSAASSHASRLLPLRKLKTLSIGSWCAACRLLCILTCDDFWCSSLPSMTAPQHLLTGTVLQGSDAHRHPDMVSPNVEGSV